MRKPSEIMVSPSGHYKLKAELNNDRSDPRKYKCVVLTLYDSAFNELSRLQTRASGNSKWAVGWHSENDTVILPSRDIGTNAYRINANKRLEGLQISRDIDAFANKILDEKYE
jgi:hypothetical protein